MKKFVMDPKKVVPYFYHDGRQMEVKTRRCLLRREGSIWRSAMKYVPGEGIIPDGSRYDVEIVMAGVDPSGVFCPDCLEKFLATGQDYKLTFHGQIVPAKYTNEEVRCMYGDGIVPMLHWGYCGDVGKCWPCHGGETPDW